MFCLGGFAPVAVTAHKSLNSSKGVIRNWELARTDPEEIKENVPMITDVQRIVVKRNNTEIKTNTLILTFNTPKIPDSLKICYLNIPVSQYVPNPIRCYKCQRFGHVTSKCKHNEVCARCSATGHKDDTCTKEHKCVNCEENHASYNKKNAVFINESMIFSILEYHRMYLFFEARAIYQKSHGQRVMSYAGAAKAPIQNTSVCTQTDVSWVGAQPVTRKQRPAASVTSRPVPSVSRSVGTTTRVADAQKPVAPARGQKKDKTSNKPSSPKVSPVHESESDSAYFTVKTHKGKRKENSPVTSVHISPIKFKDSILNKERLKRSYQASDFLPETEISPSRSELKKHKVKKGR